MAVGSDSRFVVVEIVRQDGGKRYLAKTTIRSWVDPEAVVWKGGTWIDAKRKAAALNQAWKSLPKTFAVERRVTVRGRGKKIAFVVVPERAALEGGRPRDIVWSGGTWAEAKKESTRLNQVEQEPRLVEAMEARILDALRGMIAPASSEIIRVWIRLGKSPKAERIFVTALLALEKAGAVERTNGGAYRDHI